MDHAKPDSESSRKGQDNLKRNDKTGGCGSGKSGLSTIPTVLLNFEYICHEAHNKYSQSRLKNSLLR